MLTMLKGEVATEAMLAYLAKELGDKSDGKLVGRLAQIYGIDGSISLEEITKLFSEGVLADENGSQDIFPRVKTKSASVIFAAPKSVSTLAVLSPNEQVRNAVQQAWQASVEDGLAILDKVAAVARTGASGIDSSQSEGLLIWRENQPHLVSGHGDPHLHTHCVVANATRVGGKWYGVDTNILIAAHRYAEATVQVALASRLTALLGEDAVKWDAEKRAPVIISTEKATPFLSRRGRMCKVLGATSAQRYTVWRATRAGCEKFERETHALLLEGGIEAEHFRDDAREAAGLDPEDLLLKMQPAAVPKPLRYFSAAAADKYASDYDLRQKLLTVNEAGGALTAGELLSRTMLDEQIDLQSARYLISSALKIARENGELASDITTDELDAIRTGFSPITTVNRAVTVGRMTALRVVTQADLDAENEFINQVAKLASQKPQPLKVRIPEGFSSQQAEVLATLAAGRKLTSITGVAGAGKTLALLPYVDAVGRNNVVVATRNNALALDLKDKLELGENSFAKELKLASASFATLRLLDDERTRQLRGKTLIIDEAGLVDRDDWNMCVKIATDNDMRIVAIGDRAQNAAIDRRPSWALVSEAAGRVGAYAELNETWRCKEWKAEHDLLRERQGEKVAELAAEEGRIIACNAKDLPGVMATLAKDGNLILTKTNALAKEAAKAAQSSRQGNLGEKVAKLNWQKENASVEAEPQDCHIGDEIRFRSNKWDKGRLIWANGQTGVVVAAGKGGVVVEVAKGRRLTVETGELEQSCELAYASTGDAFQGGTTDGSAAVITAGMNEHDLYNTATRGRKPPKYVVVNNGSPYEKFGLEEAKKQLAQIISTDTTVQTLQETIDNNVKLAAQDPTKVERMWGDSPNMRSTAAMAS